MNEGKNERMNEWIDEWLTDFSLHCKKELAVFPSPAGMSLIKLFLGGKNLVFSRPERVWSVISRLGTGKWLTPFYSVWMHKCAAKVIFCCPSMNSHRPRSQNTAKEQALIPEKDSERKCHGSLEKSSKNYKPLEKWAKPNLLPDVTPQPANFSGKYFWRICHVVEPDPPELSAFFSCSSKWPKQGRGRGESRFDLAH